jgi:hypothetical protein
VCVRARVHERTNRAGSLPPARHLHAHRFSSLQLVQGDSASHCAAAYDDRLEVEPRPKAWSSTLAAENICTYLVLLPTSVVNVPGVHFAGSQQMCLGRRLIAASLMIVGLVLASASAGARTELDFTPAACPRLALTAGSAKSVDRALRARKDVWGNSLVARPSGPTYEGVRRYLKPLLLARAPGRKSLTDSGFHYLAFTQPRGAGGSGSPALHVADGSQILSKRTTGRRLTISVGRAGRERLGACLARLALSRGAGDRVGEEGSFSGHRLA